MAWVEETLKFSLKENISKIFFAMTWILSEIINRFF